MKIYEGFKNGFTIIELLIVMAILGVLGTGVILLLNPGLQLAKARDARRKSDLNTIRQTLEAYYNDHGQYPYVCNSPDANSLPGYGQPWISQLGPYAKQLPVDPVNTYTGKLATTYQSKNIGTMSNKTPGFPCDTQHFVLGAHLEVSNDSNINWDYTDFWGGWNTNYVVT